jgi:hypothetical protein
MVETESPSVVYYSSTARGDAGERQRQTGLFREARGIFSGELCAAIRQILRGFGP